MNGFHNFLNKVHVRGNYYVIINFEEDNSNFPARTQSIVNYVHRKCPKFFTHFCLLFAYSVHGQIFCKLVSLRSGKWLVSGVGLFIRNPKS